MTMARKRTPPLIIDFDNIPVEALVPEDEQAYEIPAHWRWVRLGSICNLLSGRDEPLSECNAEGTGIPYVMGASNLSDAGLTIERWIVHPKVVSKSGDLLISVKGTVGKLHIQQEPQINLSRQIMAIQPGELIEVTYLLQHVNEVLQGIQQQAVGLIPGISRAVLLSLPIPLPPLNEQKAIVEKLQATNQKIDNILERLDQFLDEFPKKQFALVQTLLAGYGTPNYEANPPEAWRVEPLGKILRVSSGKGLTAKEMHPDGSVPVYGGNGVTGYHDQACYPAGTIAIGRVGYYCGAVHMSKEECWVTDNALVARFNEDEIDKQFLYYLLAHTNLRVNTSSSAQPLISGKKIYDIEVHVPQLDTQKYIVADIERSVDQLVKAESAVMQSRELLLSTRNVVRQQALRGMS
ncbi:restriction endonuclease subunit S [Arthrobacter sp. Sa2CUA1]|uniref:Restriction endonuclease subunit S n=2 Tax=Arthrobacter gallicola TaxID=2762225 RepID=A0ABR8UV79_9MICC|nr:restriction endonuclease subunit S [Arthrobacter gallicola]